MKIAVISDTHGYLDSTTVLHLQTEVPDRIFHAGDITTESVLCKLTAVAPVTAVKGNMDQDRHFASRNHLLPFHREVVEGVHILMSHIPANLRFELARAQEENPGVMLLGIHGHTHVPKYEEVGNSTVLLCPGSPSEPRGNSRPGFMVLELYDGAIQFQRFVEV